MSEKTYTLSIEITKANPSRPGAIFEAICDLDKLGRLGRAMAAGLGAAQEIAQCEAAAREKLKEECMEAFLDFAAAQGLNE